MNDAIKLQISAFVDGELPDNETELLLRRLSQDAKLRSQVARYLTIGHAIRGDLNLAETSRLRGRIAATLGAEVTEPESVTELVPGKLMRPVAGVAVAASVAVMALMALRILGTAEETTFPGFDDVSAVAIDGGPSYTEPPAAQFMSNRPSDMLTLYYLRHGQQSPNLGSRLVGLEVREDKLTAVDSPAGSLREQDGGRPDTLPPGEDPAREDPIQQELESAQ